MTTSLYFATDVHGSEKCFKKFLNAWKFYKVKILILGGDITGKAVVPLIEREDGKFSVNLFGEDAVVNRDQISKKLSQESETRATTRFAPARRKQRSSEMTRQDLTSCSLG